MESVQKQAKPGNPLNTAGGGSLNTESVVKQEKRSNPCTEYKKRLDSRNRRNNKIPCCPKTLLT